MNEDESQIDLTSHRLNPRFLLYLAPFVSLALILIVMNFYSPLTVGPIGILGVFALFYVFCLSIAFLIVRAFRSLLNQFFGTKLKVVSFRKAYYLSSAIAFLPVFLLALNSIGQLKIGDIVLVVLLVGLACFYINRRVH